FETRLAGFGRDSTAIRAGDYLGPVVFGTVLFLSLLPHRELYDPQWFLRFRQLAGRILHAAVVWLIAFSTLAWMLRTAADVSRIYVLIAFTITTSAFLAWRFALHQVMCADAVAGRFAQRVVFVGWSEPARILAQTILRDGRHPYELAGYLPSRREGPTGGASVFLRKLGEADDLAGVLRRDGVDMVILADTDATSDETVALANLCEKELVEFKVIATCSQILCSCLRLQTVSGVPVLGISFFPLENPLNAVIKQAIDLVGAAILLLASAPVIAVFAALVYRESPGAVFYRQRRVGVHGRHFWMYKIRSMRPDAERDGRVGWTVREDPRRLRIGAFMRRWNIDELPQFWNVLRGDMSLVGPRPERPELIRRFKEEISHYNVRHNVKPGITGWAQVNGLRGDTDLHERLRCDLFYIENWSPLLDLQIAVMTLFRHKNAA
ncbi:MAG TPA: exopolysaccharide biosynthesis polyprenyl glycosylphosphotransferase, partial [Opitutaceae bacterium]|nr:exopolysaccharide biosynthesis polyprenyl glycosylphosphotransferase [Opitutaceae bacterium]